jgi:RNA polymerase sigma factor (sigma-70 family)
MTRIAVNKAIDYTRKAHRQREVATACMEELFIDLSYYTYHLDQPIIKQEQRDFVTKLLGSVPLSYRNIMKDYYMEEKSHRQIAEEYGIEVRSVESKLYRAKKWLREHWKEEDF